MIRAWQVFSRGIFPPACRYYPSCSEYTLWAIRTYGLRHGILLGAKRLLTCHPLYKR
ncbi:MAG: membrane protein insertion efficiency factor YidD [Elusimicrobia bacterium]|nr:membrane protein insertion efficiency factor YidD [Elusimicrobiota bacterium]